MNTKQRVSWKTLLLKNKETIERGIVLEVDTPTPSQHIALRAAALNAGYTAWCRNGRTYVAKAEQAEDALIEGAGATRYRLKEPKNAPFMITTREQAIDSFVFGFYHLLNNEGPNFDVARVDPMYAQRDRLKKVFWWWLDNMELYLRQPEQATLNEMIAYYYNTNNLAGMLEPWISACARLQCSPFVAFNRLDEPLPVMSEEEAFKSLEEFYLKILLERKEADNDKRLQELAQMHDIND